MRPRDLRQLLEDVQKAIEKIERFTEGVSLEQYKGSEIVRSAVERNFITIGEAFARMKASSGEAVNKIDHAVRISNFRNFLVHEYESVDDEQVWTVVQKALPILKQQINAWAAELGMESPPEPAW